MTLSPDAVVVLTTVATDDDDNNNGDNDADELDSDSWALTTSVNNEPASENVQLDALLL